MPYYSSNMKNNVQDTLFWLKNKFVRNTAYKAYLSCLDYDSKTGQEKQQISFEKLQELVKYVYSHVEFYHDYYDKHHFHPSQLNSWDDWEKIPPLEKDIVRFHTEEMLSDEYVFQQLSCSTTSGSTGTPLKVYKEKGIPVEVMGWRAMKWWNISPAANMGKLHRNAAPTFISKLKNQVLWWPTKRAYFCSGRIVNDEMISCFVNDLLSKRIVWLQGYSSSLESVADYIIKNAVSGFSLKMVWCTSSPLTKTLRSKLEKAFGCDIMDQYGCNEMWNIAIQKKGEPYLTICSDFVHVDVVDENNNRCLIHEEGDILITDLNCKAFPLIKYRLGDKGSFAMEGVNSDDGYPKLNFVKGRTSDNIILPNGDKIDGVYLTAICDKYPDSFSAYQIKQYRDYSVKLFIVLRQGISKECQAIKDIDLLMNELIKGEITYNLEIVPNIDYVKGKIRYIVSEITGLCNMI